VSSRPSSSFPFHPSSKLTFTAHFTTRFHWDCIELDETSYQDIRESWEREEGAMEEGNVEVEVTFPSDSSFPSLQSSTSAQIASSARGKQRLVSAYIPSLRSVFASLDQDGSIFLSGVGGFELDSFLPSLS